jgi:excisionase family DNA binding protein
MRFSMAKSTPRSAAQLGITHVARSLELSESTVRRLADTGAIPHVRDASQRRLFKPADVDAFKTQRQK